LGTRARDFQWPLGWDLGELLETVAFQPRSRESCASEVWEKLLGLTGRLGEGIGRSFAQPVLPSVINLAICPS
jgi:hypothetical protein